MPPPRVCEAISSTYPRPKQKTKTEGREEGNAQKKNNACCCSGVQQPYLELEVRVGGVEVVRLLGLGVKGGGGDEDLLDLVANLFQKTKTHTHQRNLG